MKKFVIILVVASALIFIIVLSVATFIAFKVVGPTTATINKDLEAYINHVVRIPEGIQRPSIDYSEIKYFWEMETLEKEVTGVNFMYTPAYSKNQNSIEATLEIPQNSDPSIFNKVLPAVISDEQSLKSAQDPPKANLAANPAAGYKSISLSTLPSTGQTTKIIWEFSKNDLPEDLQKSYQKLQKFPEPILSILYGLPHFLISLVQG